MSIIGIVTLIELTLYEKGWYAFGNNVVIDWSITLSKVASIILLYLFIVANIGVIR